jgi:hypothetical protein
VDVHPTGTESRPAPDATGRSRVVASVRWLLVALWVVTVAAAWWSAPRPVSADQLRADLAAGRITSFVQADGWDETDRFLGLEHSRPRQSDGGWLRVWGTDSRQVRYTGPGLGPPPAGTSGDEATGSRVGTLTAELRAAGIRSDWPPHPSLEGIVSVLAAVLALVWLVILLSGPPPVLGTRWFWFWAGLAPFGLGIVAWLALERPWIRPEPRERRRGLSGFAITVLASFAVPLLALALRQLLGTFVVPG